MIEDEKVIRLVEQVSSMILKDTPCPLDLRLVLDLALFRLGLETKEPPSGAV